MTPGFAGNRTNWDPFASARDRCCADEGFPGTRWSKDDTEPGQLTLDPAIAPGGVLPGQPEGDRYRRRQECQAVPGDAVGSSGDGPDHGASGAGCRALRRTFLDVDGQFFVVVPNQTEQL